MSLKGKTILVTRAKEQARELTSLLEKHEGKVIEIPLIAFEAIENNERLDQAIERLDDYDWLMFTSINGVNFFMDKYKEHDQERNELSNSIAVVGEKTEAALLKHGIKSDVMPTDYTAEGMVDVLIDHIKPGDRVLLVRGNRGRQVINEAMAKIGAQLDDITIYKTNFPKEAASQLDNLLKMEIEIDYVTFTSSSTVTHYANLIEQLNKDKASIKPKVACIGPIAKKTALQFGMDVQVMPSVYTIEALVEQIVKDGEEENRR